MIDQMATVGMIGAALFTILGLYRANVEMMLGGGVLFGLAFWAMVVL